MAGFREDSGGLSGLLRWTGQPDDDAAHRTILTWLEKAVTSGFLGPSDSLSNRMKGNLGEFVAYRIGQNYVLPMSKWPSQQTVGIRCPTFQGLIST